MSGFVPTATVDLASLSVTAREEVSPADVTAFEETPDKSYRLILVPQQRALTVTVFLEDGSSREKTLSETLSKAASITTCRSRSPTRRST